MEELPRNGGTSTAYRPSPYDAHRTASKSTVARSRRELRVAKLKRWTKPRYVINKIREWFWHPFPRIVVSVGVTFLNFLILAEDPVAESKATATLPLLGNAYGVVALHWGKIPIWMIFVKALIVAGMLSLGMFIGKYKIHHAFLRDRLKMVMFGFDQEGIFKDPCIDPRGQREKGSIMIMFLVTILHLYVGSWIYNLIGWIAIGADEFKAMGGEVDSDLHMTNVMFMRLASTGTFLGDFFTYLMVFNDMMTTLRYQKLNRRLWHRSAALLLTRVQLLKIAQDPSRVVIHDTLEHIEASFSKWAIRNLKRAFRLFDPSDSGIVPTTQMVSLLKSLIPEATESQLKEMVKHLDIDNSGDVDWKEFLAVLATQRTPEEQIRDCFAYFDRDGSGTISVDEIFVFLVNTQPDSQPVNTYEVEAIIREIDINCDGEIDFDEFFKAMKDLLPRDYGNTNWEREQRINAEAIRMEELKSNTNFAAIPGSAMSMKLRRKYTRWGAWLSLRWHGRNRLLCLLGIVLVSAPPSLFFIWGDPVVWHGVSTENGRIFLAAVITLCDLLIVIQDWEFPTFSLPHDPGTVEVPMFSLPFNINVTGKWFNYGIIFIVMILDLNMTKNQFIYDPVSFKQTVKPDGEICNMKGDVCYGARYVNSSVILKGICLLPAIFGLTWFIYLIVRYQKSDFAKQQQELVKDMGGNNELEEPLHGGVEASSTEMHEMNRALLHNLQSL